MSHKRLEAEARCENPKAFQEGYYGHSDLWGRGHGGGIVGNSTDISFKISQKLTKCEAFRTAAGQWVSRKLIPGGVTEILRPAAARSGEIEGITA